MAIDLTYNFNSAPYYDDFSEAKQFHRVLFQPGKAVQARELTQMQTIIQNQIDRFGEHVFKEGTVVYGCERSLDLNYTYVKVQDRDSSNNVVDLSGFVSTTVTGQTSGVKAYVVNYEDGSETTTPNTNTLYVKYISAGTSGQKVFTAGETITSSTGSDVVALNSSATGIGSAITYDEGIIFAKDHFIQVNKQTLILDKYSNTPSYKVGFNVVEAIITSDDDSSLLDPAQGSYNFAAPGANRLKLTPTLTKKSLTSTDIDDFYMLIELTSGVVSAQGDRTEYAQLGNELARRTFDESGDYTTKTFQIRVRENLNDGTNLGLLTEANGGDSNKLSIGIEPGKAYVHGYQHETLSTQWLTVDKGTDTIEVDQQSIPANYGNYILVDEVAGSWNLNNIPTVSLRNTAARAITNGEFGSATSKGTQIGTAKARAIVHESGNPGANSSQYRLYLFDVKMTANSFADVRSIYLNNTTGSDGTGDAVLTSNTASLKETGFNTGVFAFPQSSIKSLRDSTGSIDNDFQFVKEFDATVATDGTFSIATGSSDEVYPFSTGALNSTQKRANFVVIMNSAASAELTGTVDAVASNTTLNGVGTSFTSELSAGDRISFNAETLQVASITSANTLLLASAPAANASANVFTKEFFTGQYVNMSANGAGGARTITVDSTTQATFDLQETFGSTESAKVVINLQKTNGREIAKSYKKNRLVKLQANTHYANTVGPWGLGVSDVFKINSVRKHTSSFVTTLDGANVTDEFELDSGQRDNYYEHGRLKLKSSSSLSIGANDVLLVDLDYFTHSTSQGVGYLSVDSYPVDDANTANTTAITTQEIPLFTSPTTGKQYDLRDSIDIRPIRTNTATDSTLISTSSTNPANSSAFTIATGGQHMAVPNEDFQFDLEYYLPRKDKVVMDIEGNLKIVKGVSKLAPVEPEDLDNAMSIALVNIPPYPSIAPNVARSINRPSLATTVKQIDNRRFTMRDIGKLEQRINNLEYYTSLSLLEKDASDLQILDTNGLDRFKNGILVDAFTGHSVGDITNSDYKCSIDTIEQALRPSFNLNHIDLEYDTTNTSNVYRKALDAILTVSNVSGTFTAGETVYQGTSLVTASASGVLTYGPYTNRLYIEQVSGTFSVGSTIKGNSSSASARVDSISLPSNGNLATLPYTHASFISQPYASKERIVVSELVFNWVGEIQLNPETDTWVDTVQKPDVQINFDGNADAWEALAEAWGTQWGNWETIWTGASRTSNRSQTLGNSRTTTTTTTTTQGQTRSGVQLEVTPETQVQTLGPRVVDLSIVPYCRSREVQFTGYKLRPNSIVYPYFDGEDVSAYVTPTDSAFANTANEGGALTVESDGTVYGIFRIPNDDTLKFRVGERVFRLTDSSTNSNTDVTTSASSKYLASGLIQTTQDTVIGTTVVNVAQKTVEDSRTVQSVSTSISFEQATSDESDGGGKGSDSGDPLCQSFYVRQTGGVFLTKVDIFFSSKDDTYPITLEIREMINGLPGPKIVPYSKKNLATSEVNVSSDASAATPFVFDSPVYLQNETEYCLVLKPGGNSPEYKVWVAELGQTNYGTNERISSQAAVGVLFTSSNDRTWTSRQNEDLKFKIYRAVFDTSATGTLRLTNEDSEFFTVANVSGTWTSAETINGETRLTLNSTGLANVGETITGGNSGTTGVVANVDSTVYRIKNVGTSSFTNGETVTFSLGGSGSISSQTTPTGKFKYYSNLSSTYYMFLANTSGTFANGEQLTGQRSTTTAEITSLYALPLNTIYPQIQSLNFKDTSAVWSMKNTTTSNALDSSFTTIGVNQNNDTATAKRVLGPTTEASAISSEKSLQLQGTLSTVSAATSPVVDLSRIAAIVVGNKINNDTTGETAAGGNALAKYITKRVTLDNDQDAEDMKVYLSGYKPTGTDIDVYYKIHNPADAESFEDKSWVAMTQSTSSTIVSDSEDKGDYKEYAFTIPTANLTGDDGEVQYTNSDGATFTGYLTFSVKIVLTSTNTSLVPKVKDLRVIALLT